MFALSADATTEILTRYIFTLKIDAFSRLLN